MDRASPRTDRAALVLTLTMFCSSVWAEGPTAIFEIPAGSAPQTLREFYVQSHVRVLYLADTVKGVRTQAVSGTLAASEALARMLEGTGLGFEFEGDYAAIIKHAPPDGTTTPSSSGEGPSVPPPSNSNGNSVEEVLVTGSLIHGVFDITSPLIPLDKEDMRRTGYATVQDAIRALPLATTMTRGEVVESGGNVNLGSGINLRGLGDGATLVLVNGRRQAGAGARADFVDVSTVPWSLVDRIEVLPDGGSALYGSDAIAGVVNIIMRQNLEGAESQFRYGGAPGGAAESLMAQLAGHRWEAGQWIAGYQYYERTSLDASERVYAANTDKRPLGGRDFRSIRSNPGNVLDPRTLQPAFAIPEGQDGTSLSAGDLLPGVINYRNQFADTELLPYKQAHILYFSASQSLSERVELFTEGRYSHREVRQRRALPDETTLLRIPSTNPFFVDPFGDAPYVIVAYDFSEELGSHQFSGQTQSYLGTLGLKRGFGDSWQSSISVSHAAEELRWADSGHVNPMTLAAALADHDPVTAFNPFGDNAQNNPATLSSIAAHNRLAVHSSISSIQLLADGPLLELSSGVVKAAIGADYRKEGLRRKDSVESLGQLPRGVEFGRRITAAFAEFSVPLVGSATDGQAPPRLELSLAGRYERYDDFGQTLNPKIGLRWVPLTSLKLRASWGTSFKAPNLADLDDSRNLAGLVSLTDPRSPTGRSDVLALQGGNPDLHEERAVTWTAGFDLAPPALPNFRLSATAYSIELEDQVLESQARNPFDILVNEDVWQPVIIRNPSQSEIDAICHSGRFLGDPAQCSSMPPTVIVDLRKRNLAITTVEGLDLTLSQSFATDVGRFTAELNAAQVFRFKQAFTRTAPLIDVLDTVRNPLALQLRGAVEWHQYAKGERGFSASVVAHHAGGYRDPESPLRHSVGAWTRFDVGLAFSTGQRGDWTDDTEIVLNVTNVLNEEPPFVDRMWGFDLTNAEPVGRVISAFVSKGW